MQDEEVKCKLEAELKQLQTKLDEHNNVLKKKKDLLEACDKYIKESETAFMKVNMYAP